MPFIITSQAATADKAVEAVLCEANLLGQPDRRNSVPVLVRKISEQILLVGNDRRGIVSTVMRDGITQYAVEPSAKDFASNARLARVQKASQSLEQLRRVVMAFEPADRNPVLGHITAISDWIRLQQTGDAPSLGSTLAAIIRQGERR